MSVVRSRVGIRQQTGRRTIPTTLPVRWQDVFHAEPEQLRPLTLPELQRLHRLGFDTLARALAAGTCPKCEMNKAGTGHRQLCVEPAEKAKRESAPEPVRQPWEARPARLRRAA